jgi:hypothetical protein
MQAAEGSGGTSFTVGAGVLDSVPCTGMPPGSTGSTYRTSWSAPECGAGTASIVLGVRVPSSWTDPDSFALGLSPGQTVNLSTVMASLPSPYVNMGGGSPVITWSYKILPTGANPYTPWATLTYDGGSTTLTLQDVEELMTHQLILNLSWGGWKVVSPNCEIWPNVDSVAMGSSLTVNCGGGAACAPPPTGCNTVSAGCVPSWVATDADSLVAGWHAGSVNLSPAGDFYVFVPTCVWFTNYNIPAAPTPEVFVHPLPPDGSGQDIIVEYTINVDPQPPVVNWGDGSSSTVNLGGSAPSNPSQSCSPDPNTHNYKVVANSVQISVTQSVDLSVQIAYTNGNSTQTWTVPLAPVNLGWPSPAPHAVYQVEGELHG